MFLANHESISIQGKLEPLPAFTKQASIYNMRDMQHDLGFTSFFTFWLFLLSTGSDGVMFSSSSIFSSVFPRRVSSF